MEPTLLSLIKDFNFLLFILFVLMYSYQIVYVFVALKAKRKVPSEANEVLQHKFAMLIPARNEEVVIGELIKSIKNQNYPEELVDIFVIADNCTDQTAKVAREAGAIVKERFNKIKVGKGYALDFMIQEIMKNYAERNYDGIFVFDADNLLDENYIAEMNKTFNQGYRVVTSYRNSKNYGQNWISAGYALWFLHEAEYLNLPRMTLNSSCAVSGTGFLIHKDVLKDNGGWIHHLLTEDIEFSVSQIIKGEKIGYCRNAVFYDEQPVTFIQSWNQRLRWAKGFYQVFGKYGKALFKNIVQGKSNRFSCFDISMTIMPAMLISFMSIVVNSGFYLAALLDIVEGKGIVQETTMGILTSIGWYYGILFMIGFITIITEWKKIHAPNWKKIAYSFTFPLFMFTYIPISVVALFKDVEWKPIAHTVVKSIDEVRQ